MDLAASFQQLAKVDYLDGLGIALGTNEMSLVHMTKRFFQLGLCHVRTVPLPEAGTERLDVFKTALKQFLDDIEVSPDQVVLSLPRQTASVSRLLVPEAAQASLDQVIGYEVERLLPFPQEDIYYDYLTYPIGGEENRLGVVLFCLPRSEVEDHLSVLSSVEVRPQMVTISSSAQVSALISCAPNLNGACVLLGPEGEKFGLSFIEKQQLVASHLFAPHEAEEPDMVLDLIAQGMTRNLPSAVVDETPLFAWGMNGSLPVALDEEHDLSALASARFSVTPELGFTPSALPGLGAALQAVGEVTTGINLLPVEKRAQREKRLSAWTLVLVGLVFVLMIAWATGEIVQGRRAYNSLVRQVDALKPEVDQVLNNQAEADRLEGRVNLLAAEMNKHLLPLIGYLSEAIPTDMYLTSLRYKNGGIELSGVATAKPASELIAALNALQCLKNVAPKAPFTTTANGETFTLGAQVQHPCGD